MSEIGGLGGVPCLAQGVLAFLCSMNQVVAVVVVVRVICFDSDVFSAYEFATDTAMGSGRAYECGARARRSA